MIFFLLIQLFFGDDCTGIQVSVNNGPHQKASTFLVTLGDELDLTSDEAVRWVAYKPVCKPYDNLSGDRNSLANIDYRIEPLSDGQSHSIHLKLPLGTHTIGISRSESDTACSTYLPLHTDNEDIIQVVVRKSDDYIGFLTELIGLPFVLPPRSLGIYGHQTDMRIGTDCAELAIYGVRRMGHPVPYCGPRGIQDYLEKTEELKMGTIVHFGYQVSICYEDRGTIGTIDDEDLLIHAYQDKVAIERLGDLELADRPYKLYAWKDLNI